MNCVTFVTFRDMPILVSQRVVPCCRGACGVVKSSMVFGTNEPNGGKRKQMNANSLALIRVDCLKVILLRVSLTLTISIYWTLIQ